MNDVTERLRTIGLNTLEARLYIELLKGPSTHLKLAHATGINRTKVYRLASDLEKRSLINTRTDDRGSFLVASDPATLEVALISQEEKLKQQRAAFTELMPTLSALKAQEGSNFVVHTYDGAEGFKQMLWHELKTKGENVIFGSGTIDDLIADAGWAEKHRAMTIQTNYKVREIINPGGKKPAFTLNKDFLHKYYSVRTIPAEVLPLKNQMVIYNDTVSVYHWRDEQKVGMEIINANYAAMMRHVFELYWRQAIPTDLSKPA